MPRPLSRPTVATWRRPGYHHALGTTPKGPDGDENAVLDQYCRVWKVENLWVVDASVIPAVPCVTPNLIAT